MTWDTSSLSLSILCCTLCGGGGGATRATRRHTQHTHATLTAGSSLASSSLIWSILRASRPAIAHRTLPCVARVCVRVREAPSAAARARNCFFWRCNAHHHTTRAHAHLAIVADQVLAHQAAREPRRAVDEHVDRALGRGRGGSHLRECVVAAGAQGVCCAVWCARRGDGAGLHCGLSSVCVGNGAWRRALFVSARHWRTHSHRQSQHTPAVGLKSQRPQAF